MVNKNMGEEDRTNLLRRERESQSVKMIHERERFLLPVFDVEKKKKEAFFLGDKAEQAAGERRRAKPDSSLLSLLEKGLDGDSRKHVKKHTCVGWVRMIFLVTSERKEEENFFLSFFLLVGRFLVFSPTLLSRLIC